MTQALGWVVAVSAAGTWAILTGSAVHAVVRLWRDRRRADAMLVVSLVLMLFGLAASVALRAVAP